MLLLQLWNYMRGYVIILVEGYFLEKFINVCIHRQILLWDIKKQKNCKMELKISIKGFKLLRPVAKKTNCKVNIIRKCGLPFALTKYKKRKTFVLGIILFIFSLYILTSFIWVVDISGNKKIDSQVIIDRLADNGIRPGTLKFGINTEKIVNEMMVEIKELAWIGVSVKGTKVKIEVVEGVTPPELIPKNEPCNILAYRDGLIKVVLTKAGEQKVVSGDVVTKGQLLISGTITSENKEVKPQQVHAMGSVKANTWYESKSPIYTTLKEKERTGKKTNIYSFVLFAKEIKLFHGDIPYENYDKIEIKKRLKIGENMILPFGIFIDRYYEDKITEKEVDLDQAKKNAADNAYKEAVKSIPDSAKIVKTDIKYLEDDEGSLTADVIIECEEDIGILESIGGQ